MKKMGRQRRGCQEETEPQWKEQFRKRRGGGGESDPKCTNYMKELVLKRRGCPGESGLLTVGYLYIFAHMWTYV